MQLTITFVDYLHYFIRINVAEFRTPKEVAASY